MANCLLVKVGEGSRCRKEGDVGTARAGVSYTHSCLPVKGGEGHVPTVQGAEDDVTAARAGVHYTHS
jgi:hypothetical protein